MTKAVEFDTGPRFRRLLAPSISRSGDTEITYSGRDMINQIFFPYYLRLQSNRTNTTPNDPTSCNYFHREVPQVSEPKRIKRLDLYSSISTEGKIG